MEYYPALKTSKLSSHKKTQRNNRHLLLSERSHRRYYRLYEYNFMDYGKGKTTETVKMSTVQGGVQAVF